VACDYRALVIWPRERERVKKCSMGSSRSNRGTVLEFLCRNDRRNENILDIRCLNCTQWIHIHSIT
jgi:hypothetical protein